MSSTPHPLPGRENEGGKGIKGRGKGEGEERGERMREERGGEKGITVNRLREGGESECERSNQNNE